MFWVLGLPGRVRCALLCTSEMCLFLASGAFPKRCGKDFGTADDLLKEAEAVQLQSNTFAALEKQAKLRIERGNAALMSGDVGIAVGMTSGASATNSTA